MSIMARTQSSKKHLEKAVLSAPGMKTVAARAGVSMSTVSRALSKPELVAEATLLKIQDVVGDLGYAVNAAASSLRGVRTGIILVLIPDISNPFFGSLLKGIQTRARDAGCSILIGDNGDRPDMSRHDVQQLVRHRADGVIVVTGSIPEHRIFGSGGTPIVAVSERVRSGIPLVGIDNVGASAEAVRHLIDLGHRRICHLAGPRSSKLTDDRIAGYRLALAAANIPFDGTLIRSCDFSIASGREETGRLLAQDRSLTAIFAASDGLAVGAVARLREAGLHVPHDVSVVGFDDVELSAVNYPSLTTVHQPREEMGAVAMGMVLDLLGGQRILHDRILPSSLVIRDSSGPCAGSDGLARRRPEQPAARDPAREAHRRVSDAGVQLSPRISEG